MALAILFIYVLPVSGGFFAICIIGWAAAWGWLYKKKKHKAAFFLVLLFLLLSTWSIIHINSVQNWLVTQVSGVLSKNLKTKVSVRHVDFSLFNKLLAEGVLVEDRKHDTLLYAGTVKLNITDWFFFKDKPTLKYIGLSDAVINMNRSDSVWNYQFLVDYFSLPKSKTKSDKNGLQIDLKDLDLKNIVFNRIDKWIGQDFRASLKKFDLTADEIDFSKKFVAISLVKIDEPVFSISDYQGNKPKKDTNAIEPVKIPDSAQYQWNASGWQLRINKILLHEGSFSNDKETVRAPFTDKFDGLHLKFAQINGELSDVVFSKDTITSSVKLSTKEKSGFEVKQMLAKIKMTPELMEFNDLDITTEKSRIGNYYAMRYKNFNSDMSDFLHAVKLEGRFDKSHIHSDDIAYFAPELKNWERLIYFDGNASGTITNLTATKFKLKSDNTIIDGNISMKGLPDIYNTFIDFKSNDLQTNYNDLVKLVPTLKNINQAQLNQLGNIRFRGNFTGFIKDFVAYGNINTSIGNLDADLNMKLPDNQTPTYSGKISSAGFDMGRFFNNPKMGKVALNGKIKGRGFTFKDLNADFDGTIHRIEFSGYPYQNITLNGTFDKRLFKGHLEMDDPNLKIVNLNGSISIAGDTTEFKFSADLQRANLQQLNFAKNNFSLTGLLNLDFVGNDIDNFLGSAKIYNASLMHDSTRLSFDSLSINSLIIDKNKVLTVQSNEIEGKLTGQFKILELQDAFKVFLNRYYPSYIEKPIYKVSDQDFSFYIKTRQVDEYVKLFDKRLSGFDNSVFSGNLKLEKNEFNINAEVPWFGYDGKQFTNIMLTGRGNLDSLNTDISVSEFALSDSIRFPNTKLKLSSKNDISNIQLTTSANKTLSDAQLNASVQTYTDGVKVHFFPSSFILNDKKWNLAKDGELTIRKSYLEANDVRFTQGEQEIVFSTELDELTDHTNLVAKLKKVNINDFTQYFFKEPRLEGILTGTVKLKDPFGKQIIEYDATADNVRLDDRAIGKVDLKGEANTTTGMITMKGKSDGELYKFNINGSYNYKDSTEKQMDIAFLADRFDISLLDNYLGAVFSNMKGNANSNLKFSGGPGHKYLTGSVTVTEGSLKVKYTQCTYKFSNETIIFNPDEIDLGTLQLKDTLNNMGTASGKMQHRLFEDIGFNNIRFETQKMLLLNTTKFDNSEFYGKVIGKAVMTLDGPITDMRMNITGEPSSTDSSHIFIPTSSSQEIGKIDYIDFVQYGSKMEEGFKGRGEANFLVNMNLTANPACKIDIILDELTGDVIKGRGTGLLNIRVGSKEPLTIRGRYNIMDGEYKFNFQTVLRKYFTISRGSITWNGDPYEALINIDAVYQAKNVDFSSLTTSRGKYQQKGDLNIVAHLTNTLKEPKIAFDFVIPQDKQTDYSNDPILLANLKKFSQDEDEQNRQVASLLLFNTFISDNNGGFGAATASILSGTAGQVISAFLSNQLTRAFQKVFKDPTITPYLSFNPNYNMSNTELNNALEASGNFGLKKEYLNGRLIISLGGNIDYNNPYVLQTRNTNVLLTPDITLEYLLSADGKLRIVGFNRTVVDVTLGQRNRTGVKLSYSKDFDKLSKAERIQQKEDRKKRKNTKPA